MSAADAGGAPQDSQPSEEELRAAYEEELSRITAVDMMAQAAVSLLNIGARKLSGPPQEGAAPGTPAQPDLEQARDAIDGARALLEILQRRIPQETAPLRDALSRLQMAYARDAQAAGAAPTAEAVKSAAGTPPSPGQGGPAGGQGGPAAGESGPAAGEQGGGPGPAEASGRLWVPGR